MQAPQLWSVSHLNALLHEQEGRTKGKKMRRKRDANRNRGGREGGRGRSIVGESKNQTQTVVMKGDGGLGVGGGVMEWGGEWISRAVPP